MAFLPKIFNLREIFIDEDFLSVERFSLAVKRKQDFSAAMKNIKKFKDFLERAKMFKFLLAF